MSAATEDRIWSGQFDDRADDPVEMEDKIPRSLFFELLFRLIGVETHRSGFGDEGSPFDLVVRGRRFMWHVNEADVLRAQALFKEAVAHTGMSLGLFQNENYK